MKERELGTPYVVSSEGRCNHSYLIMETSIEAGSYYYARCLVCLTRGPKRTSSWAAYRALKEGAEAYTRALAPLLLLRDTPPTTYRVSSEATKGEGKGGTNGRGVSSGNGPR